MSNSQSTLSGRGDVLASVPNMRDKASDILSEQWHPTKNPKGTVNIGTAENHLMLPDLAEFIKSANLGLKAADFDYGEGPWGLLRLRTAFANFINRKFAVYHQISADDITCANGCSSILNMLSLSLGDPGDGILLSKPTYVAFESEFALLGSMKAVYVLSDTYDPLSLTIVSSYETALKSANESGTRVRALIISNPHNPLGRCYPQATLIALLQFCNKHHIHFISDEIYAMSVYPIPFPSIDPPVVPFTSVLSLDVEQYIDPDYVHTLYGMSKDFASGGLRIGMLHTRNKVLQRSLSAISGFHWPGSIDQIIAAHILEHEDFVEDFLATARERLRKASQLVRHLLNDHKIPYAGGSNAGFFLWVDLSAFLEENEGEGGWLAEKKLVERMKREKVFLTPGRGQASEKPGFFRLVFSRQEDIVREGVKRLVKALTSRTRD